MNSLLTVSFDGATRPLVESGDKNALKKMQEEKNKYMKSLHGLSNVEDDQLYLFDDTSIEFKKNWEDIDKLSFNPNLQKYHSITVNMDPSKIGYYNDIKIQKHLIARVVWDYRNKIKFLSCVYEYGRGKLHWHLLVNIQCSQKFKESLQEVFGRGRAVECKKIEPNFSETLNENLKRTLNYFKKEEHNKICSYMFKSK